jgi:predicted MPP superfamily phosphohydrolase
MKNSEKVKFIEGKLNWLLKGKPIRVVTLADLHFPHHLFFDSILQALSDNPPDVLILLGDALNNDPFNHWAKKVPKLLKVMPRVKEYYEKANEEFFKPLRKAVGKKCIILYQFGNHEDWTQRAIAMNPEAEGLYEIENNIDSDYIDYYVANKKLIAIGDMWFTHGDVIDYTANKTKKLATTYHRNIMIGHYHDYDVHPLTTPIDDYRLTVTSIPCLTDINPQSYGKDKPTNRSTGFASLVIMPDGKSFYTIHQIKDGEFYYQGKHYKSKQLKPRRLAYSL